MGDGTRQVLQEDQARPVFVEQGCVYRRAMPWTGTIHALLRHLGSRGFPVPEPVGVPDGWEVLLFIHGDSGSDVWSEVSNERGLVRFAPLLREYHDAVADFHVPDDAQWAFPGRGDIICHNDFAPWNTVWRNGCPVAVLDWDFAAPGAALSDVAYAARYVVPFDDDAHALRWLKFERAPDREQRLRLFADACGGVDPSTLFNAVVARQRQSPDHIRHLARKGIEPQRSWVQEGRADDEAQKAMWTEEHRALFL